MSEKWTEKSLRMSFLLATGSQIGLKAYTLARGLVAITAGQGKAYNGTSIS